MGRYANRTVTLEFPDLSEDDDLIFVKIRNPKTVPADILMPEDVPEDADGKPDSKAAIEASYEVISKLVLDWHVYDGTSDDETEPPMELPCTPEKLRKLPFEILSKLAEEIGQVITAPR